MMQLTEIVFAGVLLSAVRLSFGIRSVSVKTKLGDVIGIKVDYGRDHSQLYYGKADVFFGIPYVKPPVGPSRFAKPQPISRFTFDGSPYDASYLRAACPQARVDHLQMSEDCLTMNIFSPNVRVDVSYPVMMYIHGGHLRSGSARVVDVEGVVRNLVSRGVVVVIIQYRLGALGFFTTGDSRFPPNLGLLDQVEAIKFVVAQIENFGGDPRRLTLFGDSAGAACVSSHTYSPLSQNLFQQAIMTSGTVLTMLDGVFGRTRASDKLAELVCNLPLSRRRSNELEDCLLNADYKSFVSSKEVQQLDWKISVDGSFLPGPPNKIFTSRPNIPIIIGNSRDEWAYFDLLAMSTGSRKLSDFNETVVDNILDEFGGWKTAQRRIISQLLSATYATRFLKADDHVGWLQTRSNILTGAGFTSPIALEATWYLRNNNTDVYMYEFDYVSSVGRSLSIPSGWNPVLHGAQLPFIWASKAKWTKALNDDVVVPEDYSMLDFCGNTWSEFANTAFRSNVIPKNLLWKPTVLNYRNTLQYLSIGARKTMIPDYRPVDRAIFNRVLPTLNLWSQNRC